MIMMEEDTRGAFTAKDPITQDVIWTSIIRNTDTKPGQLALVKLYARSIARAHMQVVRICFDSGNHEDVNPSGDL
jgi:hypothetical protein